MWRNRIGLQWRAVGILEDQIQVGVVIWAVLLAELILLLAVSFQRRQDDAGNSTRRGFAVLVHLSSNTRLVWINQRPAPTVCR